jgi:hypothetical protein
MIQPHRATNELESILNSELVSATNVANAEHTAPLLAANIPLLKSAVRLA